MKKEAIKLPCEMTQAILESISEGVFTVDAHWNITSFNRAAEAITGIDRSEAIMQRCSDVFRSSLCGTECPLRHTLDTGQTVNGKTGYIIKADGDRIPISISTALLKDDQGRILGGAESFRDLSEVEALRQELDGRHMGGLVSRNHKMQKIFQVLPSIAASESTVLILGETGTGKERIARAVHDASQRHQGPFLAINCGALPDTLLESELFGYKAGAFTGAQKDKAGRFALAKGGTVFLDEIGELSPAFQVRLLRVLQERVFEPLGSMKTEEVDVRILAATHRNLATMVKNGEFRSDLYYRINVARLELPPLRERKEDIPLLCAQFVSRFNQLQGKHVQGISPEALSLLMAHHWPGNIRELENIIEGAFILCHDDFIRIEHLSEELTANTTHLTKAQDEQGAHDLISAQAIQAALRQCRFDRTAAANLLGIHKTTLYRRMERLGLAKPEKDGRHKKA